MPSRSVADRLYTRGQGGEERWYADFRDLNGKREALKPEGGNRATTDRKTARELAKDRLRQLEYRVAQRRQLALESGLTKKHLPDGHPSEWEMDDFFGYLTVLRVEQGSLGEEFDYLLDRLQSHREETYLYGLAGAGKVKLGRSREPDKRIEAIRRNSPVALDVLAIVPETHVSEKEAHEYWGALRQHGEWFEGTDELKAWLAEVDRRERYERRRQSLLTDLRQAMSTTAPPVLWWQRPQYWSRFIEGDDGRVMSVAALMWEIRELMPWSIAPAFRRAMQPQEPPGDPSVSRGDRVSVRLVGGVRGEGVVTAVDSHRRSSVPYDPLVWVRIEEGPSWAVGEETNVYSDDLEPIDAGAADDD